MCSQQNYVPIDNANIFTRNFTIRHGRHCVKVFKNTRKPLGMSSKKWIKKMKQHVTLRKFTDDAVRSVADKEIIDKIILPERTSTMAHGPSKVRN